MSLHWSVFGWLYDRPVFSVHAVTRVIVVTLIWPLLPGTRFTLLPLAVGLIYLATFAWLLSRVRVAEVRSV